MRRRHVEVWRSLSGRWAWGCDRPVCPGFHKDPFVYHASHADALQAALDHCARYPIKDVKP